MDGVADVRMLASGDEQGSANQYGQQYDQNNDGQYDQQDNMESGYNGTDGNGDGGDGEGNFEPQEWMAPDHPLMARPQKALFVQLTKADERLTLELRERTHEVEQVVKKREQIGVELYSYQQGLAKLQMQLESTHEKFNHVNKLRVDSEELMKKHSSILAAKEEDVKAIKVKHEKAQKELDKVKVTVRQISEFNEKIKSDILVTRRAAYGTEENMQKLELDKKHQDERIAQLQQQLKGYKDQLAVYEAQIHAQRLETENAKATLMEANKEMDLIGIEKKEYMNKWQSGLTGMSNRDAALMEAQNALREHREKIRTLTVEIRGYETRIKDEREQAQKQHAVIDKLESESKFVDTQLQTMAENKKTLNQKFLIMKSNLHKTDVALQSAKQTQREIKAEIEHLHQTYEKKVQEKQKLDDALMENLGRQTTIEKAAQNVFKNTQKLKKEIHEKEVKMGEVQNEVARIKVDALNTEAHNKELESTLKAYEKELQEKDKLSEKYEHEIRQRHDKIEKKQIYIARLNKKYEVMTAGVEEENTGPLEATIHNLGKEILSLQNDSAEKQKNWIRTQIELVTLMSKTDEEQDKVKEASAKRTILVQKQLRLRGGYDRQIGDIKLLKKMVNSTHQEMKKLNELVHKKKETEQKLANTIYCSEAEFMQRLKDLELKSLEADGTTQKLKAQKEELVNQIVEVENQIMLMEKKIQLERETQEALDPDYGQPEIKGMKKEIHRMQLRLVQLQRQQEKMIQDMERAIAKRESIQLTSLQMITGAIGGGGQKKDMTVAAVKKAVGLLKANVDNASKDFNKVDELIKNQEASNQQLLEELQRQQKVYSDAEDKKSSVLNAIDDAYFVKQMNLENIIICQNRAKMYQDASDGKMRVTQQRDRVVGELMAEEETFKKIKDGLSQLMSENPKYERWFRRLLETK